MRTALVLLVLAAAARAGEVRTSWFLLERDGVPAGFLELSEEARPDGTVVRSHRTSARLADEGPAADLRVTETTVSRADTGALLSVRRTQVLDGAEQVWEGRVEDGAAVFGEGPPVPVRDPVDLMDGRTLLARTAGGSATVETLAAQVSRVARLDLHREPVRDGLVPIRVGSRDLPVDLTILVDPATSRFRGLVDHAQGIALRPGRGAPLTAARLRGAPAARPVRLPTADPARLGEVRLALVYDLPDGGSRSESSSVLAAPYDGEGSPAVGMEPEGAPADLRPFLEPSPGDGDFEALRRAALPATAILSTNRAWDHAVALADWVGREIAPAPVDRTASEALAARAASPLGQARLLVALCRAHGIPARNVSGVALTSFLGGTAVPHHWVEVHVGERGFLPLDPGRSDHTLPGAGLVPLPEGANLRSIEVLEAIPVPSPRTPRAIPFEADREYVYEYRVNGERIGENRFRFQRRDGGWRLPIETEMAGSRTQSVLVADADGHPRSYAMQIVVPGRGTGRVAVTFSGDRAEVEAHPVGRPPVKLSRAASPPLFLFDNNSIPHWALFLPRLGLEPGDEVQVRLFHPQLARVLPLTFRAGDFGEIDFRGRKVRAFPVRTVLTGKPITFWLDADHRLIRDEEGPLAVDLVE